MTPDKVWAILSQPEGLKLDFKREYKLTKVPPQGTDQQQWTNFVNGQWDEFIKDVIALTNGNVGTATQAGILVIGADDHLQPDGSRQLYDTSYLQLTTQQIMAKVNAACDPPIPNIHYDQVALDGRVITIVSIPPSPYLHETSRQLNTTTGHFDPTGKLLSFKPDKTYTQYTAFIRKGEDNFPASSNERRTLEADKKFERVAMNENIKSELVDNLQHLLGRYKGKAFNHGDLYESFKRKYRLKLGEEITVEKQDLTRLIMTFVSVVGTANQLSTQFVDQAIASGKYLEYDIANGDYKQTLFLEYLRLLQKNIKKFVILSENSGVKQFWEHADARYRVGNYSVLKCNDLLAVCAMLDKYQDIVNISRALIAYIMGDKTTIEYIKLNDVTPVAEEAVKMAEETPSEAEIMEWVMHSSKP